MITIPARNVNDAFRAGLKVLREVGVPRSSRNGPVLLAPCPVTTAYERPTERVLFWADRDANPFFHLFESLWMIAGRDDVAWLAQFNSNVAKYSDDGEFFHGAYGWRWRGHFRRPVTDDAIHQIPLIVKALRERPDDRRQVLQMWDPETDLGRQDSRDLPCNLCCHFQVGVDGRLDMTVFCRSNDVVWGCYGSDSFNMSFLQEYVAAGAGVPVGRYWQVSDNWHGYVATVAPLLEREAPASDPYVAGEVASYPLVARDVATFDADLKMFVSEGERAVGYQEPFFRRVALPLLRGWRVLRGGDTSKARYDLASEEVDGCAATDLRRACLEWIDRRRVRWEQKKGGPST